MTYTPGHYMLLAWVHAGPGQPHAGRSWSALHCGACLAGHYILTACVHGWLLALMELLSWHDCSKRDLDTASFGLHDPRERPDNWSLMGRRKHCTSNSEQRRRCCKARQRSRSCQSMEVLQRRQMRNCWPLGRAKHTQSTTLRCAATTGPTSCRSSSLASLPDHSFTHITNFP